MTSLKRRRYIERYVTLFGATKTFQPIHTALQGKFAYTTILISFVVQYVCFLVLYQTFPCLGSSGSRYDMFKTDCDFKMSEISNIACRWVKTMPELLKPRPLHFHGNLVFSVCKL